jgi:dephospho-CoA kinase
VTTAPEEAQLTRLTKKRGISTDVARQRITAQSPQAEKVSAARVIIDNGGSFEDTWRQVQAAWGRHIPADLIVVERPQTAPKGVPVIEHAGPRQAEEIAAFITQMSKGRRTLTKGDVMAAFGEKAYILLRLDGHIVGLAGWQVENLVARASEVYLEPGLILSEVIRVLLDEIERASFELQCEALLLFLPPHLARHHAVWEGLGYELRAPQDLEVSAWVEAALDSMPVGTAMLFKQLRKDRILRPV